MKNYKEKKQKKVIPQFYYLLKKYQAFEIEFFTFVGTLLKKKKIAGLCTNIKKSSTNPSFTIRAQILNETVEFTFLLKSPLIRNIKKI